MGYPGNSTGPVRGVLFDAGNTLIRVRSSVGAVYAAVARRHGVETDPEQLDTRFHLIFSRRRGSFLDGVSHPHSPEREKEWWRALVAQVFIETPGMDPAGTLFGGVFEELYREFEKPRHWQVFDDVYPCLDILDARGLPFAVVSNWDSRLHPVLDGLGLAARFRFVLTSAEFGAEKPHPSIFRAGASGLGIAPEQVLHVGDLLKEDVQGAREAGLRALWLQRDGNMQAGSSIFSLAALPALLGG